jgi:hypothetical protein
LWYVETGGSFGNQWFEELIYLWYNHLYLSHLEYE